MTKPPEKSLSTSNALSQKKDLRQKRDERGEFIISDLFPISRICLFPRLRACGFSSMCFWVFGPSDRLALLLLSVLVLVVFSQEPMGFVRAMLKQLTRGKQQTIQEVLFPKDRKPGN